MDVAVSAKIRREGRGWTNAEEQAGRLFDAPRTIEGRIDQDLKTHVAAGRADRDGADRFRPRHERIDCRVAIAELPQPRVLPGGRREPSELHRCLAEIRDVNLRVPLGGKRHRRAAGTASLRHRQPARGGGGGPCASLGCRDRNRTAAARGANEFLYRAHAILAALLSLLYERDRRI